MHRSIFRLNSMINYKWKFHRLKLTKCLASNKIHNRRKVRPANISINEHNLLMKFLHIFYFHTCQIWKCFGCLLIKLKFLDLEMKNAFFWIYFDTGYNQKIKKNFFLRNLVIVIFYGQKWLMFTQCCIQKKFEDNVFS